MVDTRWMNRAGRGLTLGAVLAMAACGRDESAIAPPATPDTEPVVRLALSSATARAGERVAVAVDLRRDGGTPLLGVQGWLRYDAARLEYVGQAPDAATIAMLNDAGAARGELRLLSVNPHGLPTHTATLLFEVKAAGWAATLDYDLEEATTGDEAIRVVREDGPVVDATLGVPAARPTLTVAQWDQLRTPAAPAFQPMQLAGQYAPDLRFGNANLSATTPTETDGVTVADVTYLAGVSVGNTAVSDATNRDAVIAGNVFPFNAPGLGEPGDALRPGVEGTSPGNITVSDVTNVAQEAVGINRPVVGDLIPGRGILPPAGAVRVVPGGTLATSETWSKDTTYVIGGIVRVDNGNTLTVQPGTRIISDSTVTGVFIVVERNGRAVMDGTALEPIVMSCQKGVKSKGCGVALVVNGNAQVNEGTPVSPPIRGSAGGCNERVAEGGAAGTYGGCDASDSSGVIRYVRIEYPGRIVGINNEINGLTLNGVGSRTVVDYVQVHAGLDDGIEFFGGSVNVSHLLLTANSDDAFDFSFGWNGRAQFVIVQQDSLDSDKGIEADNTENAATYGTSTPRTMPQLWNFTFVGEASTASTSGVAGNNVNDAFHLRRGTGPSINNALVYSYAIALDLDDQASTCVGINAAGLNVRNSIFARVTTLGNADADAVCGPYAAGTDVEGVFLTDAANGNGIVAGAAADSVMFTPLDVRAPDFRLRTSRLGATPPAGFDASATYVGAVPPATSGTRNNIAWYMGWTRPWESATAP